MWRASESVTSAKQICSCKIDDLISAAVHNGANHVEAESQSLLHVDRRRHRELLAIHDHIHQCWPIVGQRLCQNQTQVFWPFYTDTKDVCGLSKFGEIGVNQVCTVVDKSSCLHLQLDKAQRVVVENDELHR